MKLLVSEWVDLEALPGVRLLIRPMTGMEFFEMQQTVRRNAGRGFAEAEAAGVMEVDPDAARIMLRAIEAWEGIEDELTPETVEALPAQAMGEALSLIMEKSVLMPDQEKNSSSQPRSRRAARTSSAQPANGGGTATTATRRRSRSGKSKATAGSSS